jgi:deoxyadenosine/deoxycytidine kinase
MGKLIAILGNSGSGKSTLAQLLCARGGYAFGFEQHQERPFQSLFCNDLKRYALTNQFDYLLLRAEQENSIRQGKWTGIVDGGLEQDYFLYTRLFHQRGYLSDLEYDLCGRFYTFLRRGLPPPDLIILLETPLRLLASRFQERNRKLEITKRQDLKSIQSFIEDAETWLPNSPLLRVDTSRYSSTYDGLLLDLISKIDRL